MSTSSITSKGQVTIPSAIREKYQLQPGDKVLFQEKDGVIILTPMSDDIEALGGCLAQHTNGRKASLDDMEQAIKAGASETWINKHDQHKGKQ
ncbi:AbrB/MazE/SpoVT family DNA-binding domain-containing protein [Endozoicomonas sp. GU-1]|uniref:AbrB/MazE/SpoVT family DNA-binding domain-containing protein n=1 Tax=Endozoicomonas sp. GU-1 TaxID=3009078 RepID=UPI0022B58806|nr:AbrB/MazE/SpoVT family DNA-binding domain-containing protein [Endozoicomonas sp. GU-1]WBA82876.1 AbrB/MazE/SpoVT family DNA-binding domain-containing protein [Endozoicomonas sp. GU-1]WBA85804.1 AbrB/MazE/SpoVT family DNA-binding domain-containing protein [Endozoicomonas sp. GU-1]